MKKKHINSNNLNPNDSKDIFIPKYKKYIQYEIKIIYKTNYNWNFISSQIKTNLPHWITLLGGSTTKNKRWLTNVIYKKTLLWAKKKHKRVPKSVLFMNYLKYFKLSFPKFTFPFPIHASKLHYNNIQKEKIHIYEELLLLKNLNKGSGIYYFYMTHKPLHGYVGSSKDLYQRIRSHYYNSNSNITNKHPKFYNAIRKYGLSSFSLVIIELHNEKNNTEFLFEREQVYLNRICENNIFKNLSLNLRFKVSGIVYPLKPSFEEKKKMSQAKLDKTLSAAENISIGQIGMLAGQKDHQWNKPLTVCTKNLITEKLKGECLGSSLLRMPIHVYDINNNLIKIFNSKIEAKKILKIGDIYLKKVLNNEKLFKDENSIFSSGKYYKLKMLRKKVIICDINNRLVMTFKTETEAYKFLQIKGKVLLRLIKSEKLFEDTLGLIGLKGKSYKLSNNYYY